MPANNTSGGGEKNSISEIAKEVVSKELEQQLARIARNVVDEIEPQMERAARNIWGPINNAVQNMNGQIESLKSLATTASKKVDDYKDDLNKVKVWNNVIRYIGAFAITVALAGVALFSNAAHTSENNRQQQMQKLVDQIARSEEIIRTLKEENTRIKGQLADVVEFRLRFQQQEWQSENSRRKSRRISRLALRRRIEDND